VDWVLLLLLRVADVAVGFEVLPNPETTLTNVLHFFFSVLYIFFLQFVFPHIKYKTEKKM
jgi:hypothetical protein